MVSDSHGDEFALRRAIAAQPEAKLIFHLGDGAAEALKVADELPERNLRVVSGNRDWGSIMPETGLETAGGRLIFYTHGHRYDAKSGLYRLICAAMERRAVILLFGHTHIPLTDYDDGLYILNPGSLANRKPTYGIIDITPAGIVTNIVEMRS